MKVNLIGLGLIFDLIYFGFYVAFGVYIKITRGSLKGRGNQYIPVGQAFAL